MEDGVGLTGFVEAFGADGRGLSLLIEVTILRVS
jgi:hypothetical protein